jgi:hypothetical protein
MTYSHFISRTVLALVLLTVVSACSTKSHQKAGLQSIAENNRVVVMPVDVEVSELTVAGLPEPNAAWTRKARSNVDVAISQVLADHNEVRVRFDPLSEEDPKVVQAIRLHEAVGTAIRMHKYLQGGVLDLPTKKDRFDWTLAEAVEPIRQQYDADYALFIFLRDSFSSTGRAALMVTMALLGVGIPGGSQVGFASLVDLQSGDVIWFNLLARGTGDIRDPERALEAVRLLLDGMVI